MIVDDTSSSWCCGKFGACYYNILYADKCCIGLLDIRVSIIQIKLVIYHSNQFHTLAVILGTVQLFADEVTGISKVNKS